jgi:nitroreductase
MVNEILPEIKNRKSITLFKEKDIEKDKINALIDAAKCSPSSYNNQPWNYVFVHKSDNNRKEVEDSLIVGNGWAKKASYLIVVGGDPDRDTINNGIYYYLFDIGLSVMSLVLEAEHQGLRAHQMSGWEKEKLKKAVDFPNAINPIVVIAVGYEETEDESIKSVKGIKGLINKANETIKNIIIGPRKRKPINQNFFFGIYSKKV